MKRPIIIVGGGLFGCIAALHASRRGYDVTVIDSAEPMRASPAAGCVFKPSWLASIGAERYKRGIELLDELYGVLPITFSYGELKVGASRVDPGKVFNLAKKEAKFIAAKVGYVKDDSVFYNLNIGGTGHVFQEKGTVLVAAGIWSRELVPSIPPVKALVGTALRFKGQLEKPKFNVWAPYRQELAFNISKDTIWYGDGTAILQKNWEESTRIENTVARATKLIAPNKRRLGTGLSAAALQAPVPYIGARPYVEGRKDGYLEQHGKHLYVSTGGAKNGIILAAVQALEFIDLIEGRKQ